MGNCEGLQAESANTVMLFQKKKANIVLQYIHRLANIICITVTSSEARSKALAF